MVINLVNPYGTRTVLVREPQVKGHIGYRRGLTDHQAMLQMSNVIMLPRYECTYRDATNPRRTRKCECRLLCIHCATLHVHSRTSSLYQLEQLGEQFGGVYRPLQDTHILGLLFCGQR